MHAITHPHASAQTRVFQIAIRSGGGGWGGGGGGAGGGGGEILIPQLGRRNQEFYWGIFLIG